MKIINDNGYNDAELRAFIPLIRKNTLEAIQCLCNVRTCTTGLSDTSHHASPLIADTKMMRCVCVMGGMFDMQLVVDILKLPFNNDGNRERAQRFIAMNLAPNEAALANTILSGNKPSDYIMDILALWKGDDGIAKAYAQSKLHDLSLPDSAEYFLNAVERTFDAAYLPTDMDVLRARSTTVGIQQIDFSYERRRFRLYDVGGQVCYLLTLHPVVLPSASAVLICVRRWAGGDRCREVIARNGFIILVVYRLCCGWHHSQNTISISSKVINSSPLTHDRSESERSTVCV